MNNMLDEKLQKMERKLQNIERRKNKGKKILALMMLLVLFLTGTYAWNVFNQRAINPLWDRSVEIEVSHGGRIHNNYDGFGVGNHNKDIYAENFGDENLFVRVQLREFLSLEEGEPLDETWILTNPDTWSVYLSHEDDVHVRRTDENISGSAAAEIGAAGVDWQLGEAAGAERKMFMPTHNQVVHQAELPTGAPGVFDNENTHLMTSATGNAIDWIASGDLSSITQIEEFAAGMQTGATIDDGSHDFWRNLPIGERTYTAPLLRTSEDNSYAIVVTPNVEHTAQETLAPTGDVFDGRIGVMTVANWQALPPNEREGNFWILDTDGWFYWNGAIPPGEGLSSQATSLLLDGIGIDIDGDGWEYATMINADFFIAETRGLLNPVITTVELNSIFERYEIASSIIPNYAGAVFTDPDNPNLEWRVLVPNDRGRALIITENVHDLNWVGINHNRYNFDNEFTLFEISEMNILRLPLWYSLNVGETIRSRALHYEFQDNDGNRVDRSLRGAGIEHDWISMDDGPWIDDEIEPNLEWYCTRENANTNCPMRRAITRPGARVRGESNPLFLLSVTEVNTYFGTGTDDEALAARVAVGNQSHGWPTDETSVGDARHWWTRSPGQKYREQDALIVPVLSVWHDGYFTSIPAYFASIGVRPALWVRR